MYHAINHLPEFLTCYIFALVSCRSCSELQVGSVNLSSCTCAKQADLWCHSFGLMKPDFSCESLAFMRLVNEVLATQNGGTLPGVQLRHSVSLVQYI